MATSSTERMKRFKESQLALGRKPKTYYTTDEEHEKLKKVLAKIREMNPPPQLPKPKTARDEVLEKVAGLSSALNSAVAELTKAVEKL